MFADDASRGDGGRASAQRSKPDGRRGHTRPCPGAGTALDIPLELLPHIFELLPFADQRRAALVCRRWWACLSHGTSGALWEDVGIDFPSEVGCRRLNVHGVVAWLRGKPIRCLRLKNSYKVRARDVAPTSMPVAVGTLHSTLEELHVLHCSNILGVRSLQALGDVLVKLKVLVVTGIRASLRLGLSDFGPLSHLPLLEHLELSVADRTDNWGFMTLPDSWQMLASTLKHLKLKSHDGLTQEGAQVVTTLTRLEVLCMEDCGLSGLPTGFGALSGLRCLTLNASSITKDKLQAITQLSHLRELHLRGCSVLRQVPTGIDHLTSLMVLTLGGSISQFGLYWGDLASLTLLRVLDLDACGIGAVPKAVCALQSLQLLSLGRNRLEAASLDNLAPLSNLQFLCLRDCSLTEIPGVLMHLKLVKMVDLSNNSQLRIPTPVTWLASLHHLLRIDLRKSADAPEDTAWDSLSISHLIGLVAMLVTMRGSTTRSIVQII
ncbi:unnamed protein product [Ostreobium quekettii]|uniref:F-box domain-containing protein n=1 Tax=Ostreobium quekettii TaxID=121088 RepID=A0A8S1J485_9CHLO|nr:unnamed protein product [Ostreobium quekettii]